MAYNAAYHAYVSTAPSTQSSLWKTSFATVARRQPVNRQPASRICWATVRDGLALAAMFGSFYFWLWLGWAIAPN